eukprot:NODE_599_length_1509_cov_199.892466_g448_i0.p1 GENE.NODE_599_length_1509_cov_199.892466_g448_i0~~NODE_599_length_1509_cov_199.892466_g448_i0.p1  ORF type:complete len:417 (-),score=147.60 NODE_599_length_1509_cov_199.892466_g448_i0:154-1404(-)
MEAERREQSLDRRARDAVLQQQSDVQRRMKEFHFQQIQDDFERHRSEFEPVWTPEDEAEKELEKEKKRQLQKQSASSPQRNKAAPPGRGAPPKLAAASGGVGGVGGAGVGAGGAASGDEAASAQPSQPPKAAPFFAAPPSFDEKEFRSSDLYPSGYGLNTLLQCAEADQGEGGRKNGFGVLQTVLADKDVLPRCTSLAQWRPFPLHNSQQAIVKLGGAYIFRAFDSWDHFMSVLQEEFTPQRVGCVYYSTKSKTEEFAYVLKPMMFDEVKTLWALEKRVSYNQNRREHLLKEAEKEAAYQKRAAARARAERIAAKEAKRAERKAMREKAVAEGLEEDLEEEEEDEEGEQKEEDEEEEGEGEGGPPLSRKEREARKQKKLEEKKRAKSDALEEKEMNRLQLKLARLVDLAHISVQFA